MFTQTAQIYDLIYSRIDYSGEAQRLIALIESKHDNPRTLLDLACGTGQHLQWLSKRFMTEGVDLDPGLLAVARRKNPRVPLHVSDIASLSLPSKFDVITCLFSAIGYVKTLTRLEKTVRGAAKHLNAGGLLLIEPWFTPANFRSNTITANFAQDDERKVAWMYTSRRKRRLSVLDITYMIGTSQTVETLHEVHEIGLFSPDEIRSAFRKAGLHVAHDRHVLKRGLYIGRKRS